MKIYYKAPNNVSVVPDPLGFGQLSDQLSHAFVCNPSNLRHLAKVLQPRAQLGPTDQNLIVWWLDHDEQDAHLYGVDPTGAADSLAALNALTRACIAAGGSTALLPRKGLIQVSGQWLIGVKFVNEGEVGYGFGQVRSSTLAPSYSGSNYTLAANVPNVAVEGRGSVLWWGASEPSVETAILHYAVAQADTVQSHTEDAGVRNLCFAGPGAYVAGALQSPDTSQPLTTNVMGLFVPGSNGDFRKLTARECRRGIVMSDCYWSLLEKANAWHCNRGMVVLGHNAAEARNLKASYCQQGFEFYGQGSTFSRINTEQCGTKYAGFPGGSIWVPECDQLAIRGTYLESVGAAIKDYSIRVGLPVNMMVYSEQLDQSGSWGVVSSGTAPAILADQAVAPDGTTSGDRITFTQAVTSGGQWDYVSQNIAVVAGTTYTASIFLKAGTSTRINLQVRVAGGTGDQTVSCALTSDWQRFQVTFTPGAGATTVGFELGDSGIGPYTMVTGTVFAWGAMCNVGKKAHPYRRTGAIAGTAGNGCYWMELSDAHLSSEQGVTMDLINAQVMAVNTRFYDQGIDAQRVRADGASSIVATRSSIPLASFTEGTVQATDAVVFGIAWIYNVSDSHLITTGASTHRDVAGYSGVQLNDECVLQYGNLPAGWLARAEVIAGDTGSGGTVRFTLLNASGSTGDVPTMTGLLHTRHTATT